MTTNEHPGIPRIPDSPLSRVPAPSLEDVHSSATAGSMAGAEAIRPLALTLGKWILKLLATAGDHGLTNGELSNITALRDMTVWPRVSVQKNKGKLKDSGRTRPSPATGTAMSVWVLTTPEEEAEVLRRLKADEITEPPGREASDAASTVLEDFPLGGLFASREHIERVVQGAINARLTKMARAERKRLEKEEARND